VCERERQRREKWKVRKDTDGSCYENSRGFFRGRGFGCDGLMNLPLER
jgi:hypothetical protein